MLLPTVRNPILQGQSRAITVSDSIQNNDGPGILYLDIRAGEAPLLYRLL